MASSVAEGGSYAGSEIVLQPFIALVCQVWNSKVLACPRVMRILWDISTKFIRKKAVERGEA